jgi:hypothetical protein
MPRARVERMITAMQRSRRRSTPKEIIMKPLPLAALAAATALSTLIVLDIIWNAHNPDDVGPWLDAESYSYLARYVGIVHAGVYTLLAAALIQAGRVIDAGRTLVRVLRWIIIAGYMVFAVMYGWIGIVDPAYDGTGVYEVVITAAFAVSLLLPIVLGFALIRRREFRVPAILLIAPVVLLPLTFILGALTDWGHPGYMETAVNFGVALLCIASAGTQRPAMEDTPKAAAVVT